MSLTHTIVHRPTTILVIYLLLTALAIAVFPNLAVELFPEMDLPMVIVYTSYTGASPETMEESITKPIEGVISNVGGINTLTSTSSEGTSMVMIQFDYGTDLDAASRSIDDNVNLISDMLPEGASSPTLFKLNTNMMPVMNIAVIGNAGQTANDLRKIAQDTVQSRLDRVPGVSQTSVNGGQDAFVHVAVSQNRLDAYGITLSQVAQVLHPQNYQIGSGSITEGGIDYLVRTKAEFSDIDEIRNAMVMSIPQTDAYGRVISSTVVTIGDIAEVSYAFRDPTSLVYINGEPGVYLSVSKESDANSVQVSAAVHEALDELSHELPNSVKLSVIIDTTTMIDSTMNTVYQSLMYGVILVMVVLFIFLRSLKSTFIIGVSIPISLLMTILVMYFLDYSLNLMTLTGLILGLGMTVDSSIVVLENIFRYRERGSKLKTAALLGTREMIVAITASTLTTVCVFIPIVLLRNNLEMLGEILTLWLELLSFRLSLLS